MYALRRFSAKLVLIVFGVSGHGFAAKDTLVVGLLAEPVSFDSPQIGDLNTIRVLKRIFEGLTDLEIGTYDIGPGLAKSWDISPDGKVFVITSYSIHYTKLYDIRLRTLPPPGRCWGTWPSPRSVRKPPNRRRLV